MLWFIAVYARSVNISYGSAGPADLITDLDPGNYGLAAL
jgi:hypothetical protein